ncbi:hypothetical protein [Ralstonia sp. 3PA37C10]|jgi:hypothetical protein|uniref:hypothetical protein n=1 Tax=Ralstonia sp. 3PA37C10 TaxID=2502217 RepID=UPI0010F7CF33|nr:hypothetical protein [Ralstonia sp. 3PA37C10]
MDFKILFLLLAGAIAGYVLTPIVRRALREQRMRRNAMAIVHAQCKSFRPLPLSRDDRRGYETDRDGWIRPR